MNEAIAAAARPMRRANKQVKDRVDLKRIIKRAQVLRLGMQDDEGLFIVPVSFGLEWKSDAELPTFWIHCAQEGRKVDAWRANDRVALELDVPVGVTTGDYSCAYSYAYESIMGSGRISEVTDPAEKLHGLKRLMKHMAPDAPVSFSDEAVARVAIWRIDVDRMTGKRREADAASAHAPAHNAASKKPHDEEPAARPKLSKKERERALERILRGERCPGCGHHCKLSDPSCGKGKKIQAKRLKQEGVQL